MRIKPVGKIVLLMVVVGVAMGGWKLWQRVGARLFPEATGSGSQVPKQANLGNDPGSSEAGTQRFTAPSAGAGCGDKPPVRMLVWAWNAQMGLMWANGGPQATRGSRMCAHDVNLQLIREDDSNKMQQALFAFATELSQGNPNPQNGAHFICIMGDGSAAFLQAANDRLKRLGSEYIAKVVGSCGYSRGEDKFMGPPQWKSSPAASKGGVVAGVLRDGDWNIAQKWLGDNGLRNNPDEKTWDPDALNWVAADTYIDAAQKYIAGFSEPRPVVRNGRRTGETKQIAVQGVVTWTPGDVMVAQKKGGLVSIVSTREYASQMPNVIIGIDKWMKRNRAAVEGMLQSIAEGGDMVKADPTARRRAAEISAEVYHEENADYWERYYVGQTERDQQGLTVELGGSSVNNLYDSLKLFGLVPGAANLFKATYEVFGDIVVQQYRNFVPGYPSVTQILDTSYLEGLKQRVAYRAPAPPSAPIPPAPREPAFAERNWDIHFDTGRAAILSDSTRTLEKMRRDLLIASGALVEIHGHTDSQGDSKANWNLSEARAFSVRDWLHKRGALNFAGRIVVRPHGQEVPIASNGTPEGRARNRRVQIVLKRLAN